MTLTWAKPHIHNDQFFLPIRENKLRVRYHARYADHIWDQIQDKDHGLNCSQIQGLLVTGLWTQLNPTHYEVLNRRGNKLYRAIVIIKDEYAFPVTAYITSKAQNILDYEAAKRTQTL